MFRRAALTLVLGAAILAVPASAGAQTVTLGQVAPAGTASFCSLCSHFQDTTEPTSPAYVIPAGNWTVTSWSVMSGTSNDGGQRLQIWRPEGALYRLVAQSGLETVIAAPGGTTRTFSSNVAVQPGDHLGLGSGPEPGDVAHTYTGAGTEDLTWAVAGTPSLGQTVGAGGDLGYTFGPNLRMNLAVTLTPVPSSNPTGPAHTNNGKKRRVRKCKKSNRAAAIA